MAGSLRTPQLKTHSLSLPRIVSTGPARSNLHSSGLCSLPQEAGLRELQQIPLFWLLVGFGQWKLEEREGQCLYSVPGCLGLAAHLQRGPLPPPPAQLVSLGLGNCSLPGTLASLCQIQVLILMCWHHKPHPHFAYGSYRSFSFPV